jgi:hypothetical protein
MNGLSCKFEPFSEGLLSLPWSVRAFPFPSFLTAMAYAQAFMAMQHTYRDSQSPSAVSASPPMPQRRQAAKQKFISELSQCLFDFVIQLLPTQEEMAVKEDVRKLLERLIRTIEPGSRLLSFGSTANGFSLRNSGENRTTLLVSVFVYIHFRYGSVLSHRFRRTPGSFRSRNYVRRPTGTRFTFFGLITGILVDFSTSRNEIPRKTITTRPHTDCQALS